jgi:hypothetical protein
MEIIIIVRKIFFVKLHHRLLSLLLLISTTSLAQQTISIEIPVAMTMAENSVQKYGDSRFAYNYEQRKFFNNQLGIGYKIGLGIRYKKDELKRASVSVGFQYWSNGYSNNTDLYVSEKDNSNPLLIEYEVSEKSFNDPKELYYGTREKGQIKYFGAYLKLNGEIKKFILSGGIEASFFNRYKGTADLDFVGYKAHLAYNNNNYDKAAAYPEIESYSKSNFLNQVNFTLALSYPFNFGNTYCIKPFFESTLPVRPIGQGDGAQANIYNIFGFFKPPAVHFTFRIGVVTEFNFKIKEKAATENKS